MTISEFRRGVRTPYAWPGGYQIDLIMSDGEVLCRNCVKSERRLILEAIKEQAEGWPDCGWRPMAFVCRWEGSADYCCHCGAEMPTIYGDPDSDE